MRLLLDGRAAALSGHALAHARPLATAPAPTSSGASGSSGNSIFILPNATFFVELILFLIVFGVVALFILPPIQKAMREREERIRSGMAAGDEGRAEADRLAAERADVLDAARATARQLIEEAGRTADATLEDARRRGSAEHDRLLAELRPTLDSERESLRAELLGRLGGLVAGAASQVIGEPIEAGRHQQLIEQLALSRRGHGGAAADGGPEGAGA